jgi:hypothetical protein
MGVKRHKLPPQPVNWATPQWRHAASGIRCRADWRNAWVYDTDAGLIIAYSQAHADDAARAVLEDEAFEHAIIDEREELFKMES